MARRKKDPEIITDDYAEMLELRAKLAAKEAKVADNMKAAYALFGEILADHNPEWALDAAERLATPEQKRLLEAYGWKYIIEPKAEAARKASEASLESSKASKVD